MVLPGFGITEQFTIINLVKPLILVNLVPKDFKTNEAGTSIFYFLELISL
jgi:hypothetical protein